MVKLACHGVISGNEVWNFRSGRVMLNKITTFDWDIYFIPCAVLLSAEQKSTTLFLCGEECVTCLSSCALLLGRQ